MKTTTLKLIAALSLAALLGACSSTWEEDGINNSGITAAAGAARTADQIELFSGKTASQEYTVIQEIKVAVNKTTVFNEDPTVTQVEARLRQSAAELGGDAVVNVVISQVKVRAMSWGGRIGEGTVVKYK